VLGEIVAQHLKEYGVRPAIVSSAPAALHLMGETLENARGHVLSLALPQRSWVAMSARSEATVKIFAANYKERKRFSLSNLKYKKEDRWANIPKGVIAGLDTFGCTLHGLDITIVTEVPEGRSLGCSSSIAVALSLALVKHFDFSLSDMQVVHLSHGADTRFLGRYGSLASCMVSYFAHAGAVFSLDLRTQEHRHLRLSQGEYAFYLMDSLVPAVGASDELAARRELYDEGRELFHKIAHHDPHDMELKEAREIIDDMPERFRPELNFAIEEENRAHLVEDGLEASNIPPAGKILVRSHEGIRDRLELSCPELDWIVKHSVEVPGVLGSRLTGKGLGGCASLLVHGEPEAELSGFLTEYERIFGFQAKLRKAVPSHKAQIHPLPEGEA